MPPILELFSRYSLLLIYPGAALLLTLILTKFCIRLFPRIGMLDIPRGRHIHREPIPRGGGIAIILAFVTVAFVYSLNHGNHSGDLSVLKSLLGFLPAAAVITVTGLIDDRMELHPGVKLAAQVLAALLIYFFGDGIHTLFGFPLPWWLALPVTILWVIGIINAFNLIDGLDGLAAGLAAISGVSVAIWMLLSGRMPALAGVVLIFSGACLGFLRYNFSPAKIFMGDTGSMFLGLFFAYWSCSQISHAVTLTSLLLPLLAIGVPVFDVVLAIWRRSVRKLLHPETASGIMTGDSDHLHHRLMRRTGSQSKAALLIYIIALAFSVFGFLVTAASSTLPGIVFLIVLIAIFWVIKLADIELLDSFGFVVNGLAHPQRRLLLIALHPIVDLAIFSAAFFAIYLLYMQRRPEFPLLPSFVAMVAPFTLTLCFSGVYRTYWLRAGINRYYLLFKITALTAIFDAILIYVIRHLPVEFNGVTLFTRLRWQGLIGMLMLYYMLAALMMAGERFLLRYLESFGLRNFYLRTRPDAGSEPLRNTVIVGGGLACRLYIESLFCRYYFRQPFNILGIVDDDRAIRHLNVYGFEVLGNTRKLEKIHAKYRIDHVVLTAVKITPEALERVAGFCKRHAIPVSIYHLSDMPYLPDDMLQLAEEIRACRSREEAEKQAKREAEDSERGPEAEETERSAN